MTNFAKNLKLCPAASFFGGGGKTLPLAVFPFDHDRDWRDTFIHTVASHFNGADIFHVFARLSSKLRKQLPQSYLLDQEKTLTVQSLVDKENLVQKMKYGLRLADTINFQFRGTFANENDPD